MSQGNREQIYEHKALKGPCGRQKVSLGLPSRTPPDMSGENKATHMVPHTEDKAPNMAYCMCDDYSAVDTLVDISGCMSDWRNMEGRTGAGILTTVGKGGLDGMRGLRDESRLAFSLS